MNILSNIKTLIELGKTNGTFIKLLLRFQSAVRNTVASVWLGLAVK